MINDLGWVCGFRKTFELMRIILRRTDPPFYHVAISKNLRKARGQGQVAELARAHRVFRASE